MTSHGGSLDIREQCVAEAAVGPSRDATSLSRCAEIVDLIAVEADRDGAPRAATILRAVAGMLRADAAVPQR